METQANGTAAAPRLLEALASVTAADLAEVGQEVGRLEARLASLKTVRRLIEAQLGAPAAPAKKSPPKARPAAGGDPDGGEGEVAGGRLAEQAELRELRRKNAVHWLAEHGPAAPAQLARVLNIPQGTIAKVLDHPWFARSPQGVHVTPLARQEVL